MSDVTETTTSTAGAGTTPGADSGSSTPPASPAGDVKTFTQEDVNRLLAEEKRRAKAAADAETARQRQAAAEEAAAKAGEWQTVAQQREERAKAAEQAAEALRAERDALAAELEADLKPRVKALPDELRDLVPADAPYAQRLAMVRKLETAAKKLTAQATPGTPTGPRGIGGQPAPLGAGADLLDQKRRLIGGL